jgi:hypothetical protein
MLHILHLIRQVIERRMAVYLVIGRVIQRLRFSRVRGMYILALHHPYAHPFHAAGIYIPSVLYGHLLICSMQTASVFVVQSGFAAYKYFPQRPFIPVGIHFVVSHPCTVLDPRIEMLLRVPAILSSVCYTMQPSCQPVWLCVWRHVP